MGSAILSEILQLLTGGITSVATSVGTGLSTLAQSIFLVTENGTTSLSVFGILVVIFAAIALSLGICRLCVKWLGSLGGRKM